MRCSSFSSFCTKLDMFYNQIETRIVGPQYSKLLDCYLYLPLCICEGSGVCSVFPWLKFRNTLTVLFADGILFGRLALGESGSPEVSIFPSTDAMVKP